MTGPSAPPIQVREAGRRFGPVVALEGVSFDVPQGAILGLIGPSGSGKTTMIRLLTGTLRPTAGAVRVLGEIPHAFRSRTRERIGYMPQDFVLYPDLSAYQNLVFISSLFGLGWWRRRRSIRRHLQLFGLWHVRHRRAGDLSSGMRRRLALASALVHDPLVLFLDEPSAGIDPLLRRDIWDELRRLRDAGRTLLVTTQHVSEAEHCDGVALVAEGQLVALAAPDRLREVAFGGELVTIRTDRPADPAALRHLPGVREVHVRAPRELLAVIDHAGAAAPRIVEHLRSLDVGTLSVEEHVPSLEETFAELVLRHRRVRTGERSA
ncbi:MAG: ATP-binding cassette domain-containing protein [Candidatus Limnocylindria bacterium]